MEMFIIDKQWVPAHGALTMLELLKDDHFTTELGMFQLEANCDPQVFSGDGLSRMQAQLDTMRAVVRNAMRDGAFGISSALIYPPGS